MCVTLLSVPSSSKMQDVKMYYGRENRKDLVKYNFDDYL